MSGLASRAGEGVDQDEVPSHRSCRRGGRVAGGGALALGSAAGSAATPAPTPITLDVAGMSSASCPLPLNGSMAVKPGTTVQFKPRAVLGSVQTLSLSYLRETNTTPKPAATTKDVPNAGLNVAFLTGGTYDLSWHIDTSTCSASRSAPPRPASCWSTATPRTA